MISFPFSISNTPSKDDYNYESEYDSKINDSNININNFIDYRNNLNGIIEQQINNNINLQDFQICDEKNEDDSFLFDLKIYKIFKFVMKKMKMILFYLI